MGRASIVAALLVAQLCAVGVSADEDRRFPNEKITKEQWQTYRQELLARPGATTSVIADQLIIAFPEEANTYYIFTEPKHPAYPAIVIRKLVEANGAISVRRTGYYAGIESAFANWWKQFDEVDAEFRRDVESAKDQSN
jgi:hypothetical protein